MKSSAGVIAMSLVSSLVAAEEVDDRAYYTEYLPGVFPPNCEKPLLNTLSPYSSLEACVAMYQKDYFIEWACEKEALLKQKTNPNLLTQHDIKYLSNVINRKEACMTLLARKGKLSWPDTISRWWKGDKQ